MPVPTRPIPQQRPGTSVPRKATSLYTDWRSELPFLSDQPNSLPSAKGVRLVSRPQAASLTKEMGGQTSAKREVRLDQLIQDGRGKREKRASMATTLGFDLIPSPTVIALPDLLPSGPKPSLLSTSKSIPPKTGRTSPVLSNTPSTPSLLPQEEEEEDWEYVLSEPTFRSGGEREVDDRVEMGARADEEDGDIIVLGEMDLEDVVVEKVGMEVKKGKVSYADILGAKV